MKDGIRIGGAPAFRACKWCGGRGCLMCPKEAADANWGLEPIHDGGRVTKCGRCERPLRIAPSRRKNAEHFRLSKTESGVCPDCLITAFLYNTYPVNMQIDRAGPELLLKPGVRDAFLQCGILDRGDLNIDEVDWTRVVANWNLPVEVRRDPRNPYRMGDAKREREGREKFGLDRPPMVLGRPVDPSSGSVTVNLNRPEDELTPEERELRGLLQGRRQ